MLRKEEIVDICVENKTIPVEKLVMDSAIGRLPAKKPQDWIDTYFEPSKFDLLEHDRIRDEMIEYVKSLGVDYQLNLKVKGSYCDIFSPEYGVGFKMLNLLDHGEIYVDKRNPLHTWNDFNDAGYRIVQIFEDTWETKKPLVKNRIRNILNKSERIYARKCEIREVHDTSVVSSFVNSSHIQGSIGSAYKLGLYYNNELVSIMTFGKLRKNLGQKSSDGSWELLRFCNKSGINVVGGASKLFNHFLKEKDPESVISYADKCWSNHNCLYSKLGMQHVHESDPSYFYVIGTRRKGRFGYRKDVILDVGYDGTIWGEHTMMLDLSAYRIFDVGTTKFEYKKK